LPGWVDLEIPGESPPLSLLKRFLHTTACGSGCFDPGFPERRDDPRVRLLRCTHHYITGKVPREFQIGVFSWLCSWPEIFRVKFRSKCFPVMNTTGKVPYKIQIEIYFSVVFVTVKKFHEKSEINIFCAYVNPFLRTIRMRLYFCD